MVYPFPMSAASPPAITGRHILVRGHSFLGDALMTTPFLAALAARGPASLTVAASGAGAAVYRRQGAVTQVLPAGATLKKEYDVDFVLKDSGREALGSFFLHTRQRIGFAGEGGRLCLTAAHPRLPVHGAARYFALLGMPAPERIRYTFPVTAEEQARAAAWSAAAPVVLAPGSTRVNKQWPEAHWSALARALAGRAPLLVVGTDGERELCSRIALSSGGRSLAGETTLGELAALLARAHLLVSGDSGTMHLACAVGTPRIVALFGPTDPASSGPPPGSGATVIRTPLTCGGCLKRRCRRGVPCMHALTPDAVTARALHMLDGKE